MVGVELWKFSGAEALIYFFATSLWSGAQLERSRVGVEQSWSGAELEWSRLGVEQSWSGVGVEQS